MNIRVMYFALAFLGVFLFMGALLLIKYAQVKFPNVDLGVQDLTSDIKKEIKANGWIQKIAEFKASEEVLPVNLMYLQIDDNYPKEQIQPKKRYELIIPNCSEYSLFCLKRLAKSMNIELSIAKLGNYHSIYFLASSDLIANNFVKNLKNYNINSKIKEVK